MRILCIASGGGHLEQMLACAEALAGHDLVLAHYAFRNFRGFRDPRFRGHVGVCRGGEGGWRLLAGTAISLFQWAWILLALRPRAIFSTGAELAVIPFWLGKLLLGARCAYLETFSRQDMPSRTGPLVYPVCDAFFVQSPALLRHYGAKARYEGRLM